jgi:hypothetical protein
MAAKLMLYLLEVEAAEVELWRSSERWIAVLESDLPIYGRGWRNSRW